MLFVENPHPLGLPSFPTGHWRPVFEACNATGLPLSMHIGTSSGLISPSPETTPSVGIATTTASLTGCPFGPFT